MRRVVRRGSLADAASDLCLVFSIRTKQGRRSEAPSTKFYREPAVAGPNASNPVYDRRGAQVAADRINGDD